jgi:hypothetical protein
VLLTGRGWTVTVAIAARWRAASDKRTTDASRFAAAAGSPGESAVDDWLRPQLTVETANGNTAATNVRVNQADDF